MRGQKGRVSCEVNYQREQHGSGKHLSQGVMELGRKAQQSQRERWSSLTCPQEVQAGDK